MISVGVEISRNRSRSPRFRALMIPTTQWHGGSGQLPQGVGTHDGRVDLGGYAFPHPWWPALGCIPRWVGSVSAGKTRWPSFFSARKNERVYRTVYATKQRETRRHLLHRTVPQQPPTPLRPGLPAAQQSSLRLPAANPGSVGETIDPLSEIHAAAQCSDSDSRGSEG